MVLFWPYSKPYSMGLRPQLPGTGHALAATPSGIPVSVPASTPLPQGEVLAQPAGECQPGTPFHGFLHPCSHNPIFLYKQRKNTSQLLHDTNSFPPLGVNVVHRAYLCRSLLSQLPWMAWVPACLSPAAPYSQELFFLLQAGTFSFMVGDWIYVPKPSLLLVMLVGLLHPLSRSWGTLLQKYTLYLHKFN